MKHRKIKKETREWLVFVGIIALLYFTGWHRPLISTLQRGILQTGIFQPSKNPGAELADLNVHLRNEEGKIISLKAYSGKTLFINFWATWCSPCIAEMPDINELYASTSDEVAFFMISVDEDPTKAKTFIASKEFDFPIYFLQSGLPASFNARSIPTTYVVAPDGTIVVEQHGMAKYNTSKFRTFLTSF